MIRLDRSRAPALEARRLGPFGRERAMLERFRSPLGKYLGMAALALTTEGCAGFTKAAGVATMEPTAMAISWHAGAGTQGKLEVSPVPEQPGMAEWWKKPEGFFNPQRAMADRDLDEQGSRVPKKPKKWIEFDETEVDPNSAIAIVHLRKKETMRAAVGRGMQYLDSVMNAYDGLEIEWHVARDAQAAHPEAVALLRPLVEVAPDQREGSSAEDQVIQQAYLHTNAKVQLGPPSDAIPDRPEFASVVVRINLPETRGESLQSLQARLAERTEQLQGVRGGRMASAEIQELQAQINGLVGVSRVVVLSKAADLLAPYGKNPTRFHTILDSKSNLLTVVGFMEHPNTI